MSKIKDLLKELSAVNAQGSGIFSSIITSLNAAGKAYITLTPDIASIPEAYLTALVPDPEKLAKILAAENPALTLKQEACNQGYVLLTYFDNVELYVKEAEHESIRRAPACDLSVRSDAVPVKPESHGGSGPIDGRSVPVAGRKRSLHGVRGSVKKGNARTAVRVSHGRGRKA